MPQNTVDAILLVGTTETCPDIEYASGFRAVDPVVFLKQGRHSRLVVPTLEHGRALGCGRVTQVVTPEALKLGPRRAGRIEEWCVALLAAAHVRRVAVPPFFPHGVAVRLERAGIQVRVSREALFPERAVKRDDEIRRLRQSQQAAVIAMRAAVARIAEAAADRQATLRLRGNPLTSQDMQIFIARILLEHNCAAKGTIVAGGGQGADPHARGEGPLRAHEAIVIDIFPQHLEHGYWGDLTRTVVRGRPCARLRRMYHAVRRAQDAALRVVRPGVSGATVHRAAAAMLERCGFKTEEVEGRKVGFIHGTGHGVGLAIHEAPNVGLRDVRLRSGHVITIEPGLYYPDLGGVRIEDTIVVTPRGWQYLAPCEKRFEV